jgi:predicted Zn-dependent peptidase
MNEDDPYSELYYKALGMLYCDHPVTTRIAGTVDSIEKIDKDMLYYCHGAFYRPGNMVLCAAGNIDPYCVRKIALETLPEEYSSPVEWEDTPESFTAGESVHQWSMPVSTTLFTMLIKGEAPEQGQCLRNRLIAELACDVLFGASSELFNRLYEKGLINDDFGGDYECIAGAAYLIVSGESDDPEQVRDEILAEAARLTEQGIDQTQWERFVKAAYGAMVRRLNSLEDTCMELAQSSFDGEDYLSFPSVFQSVEKRDVEELLGRWCKEERIALAIVTPQ